MTNLLPAGELEARTLNADARIRHGAASCGLGSRVMNQAGRVGVVVRLEHVDGTLMLGVGWLPEGSSSRRAADKARRAVEAGDLEQHDVRPAGLVALDSWLNPRADRCTLTDPYHPFACTVRPQV
ncbi:hypothetical protein ACI2LF_43645 [Kribbella sp. NPDC020789]